MKEETSIPELAKTLDLVVKDIGVTPPEYKLGHRIPPSNPSSNYFDEGSEIDLRDHWRSIRKHLWSIIGITLLVTTVAFIYMARKPDIFEAQGRVQVNVENHTSATSNSKNTSIILNNENGADPAYFNTQIQILSSPALLRRVVKTLDLEHNQAFHVSQFFQPVSTWQRLERILLGSETTGKDKANSSTADVLPLSNSSAPVTAREDIAEATRLAPFVDALKESLKIERVIDEQSQSNSKETRLIDIKFQQADPVLAAKIVNVVCDIFAVSNLDRKTEANISTGDFLLKRIAQLQAQIRTDEERLINYAKNNHILTLDANQNTVVERLVGLNRQLLEAEDERKMTEAAYRAALAPGAANALTSSEVKTAEDKLTELRQRRAELLVENTEEWPEVKEISQQIEVLQKQIGNRRSSAVANFLTGLETRYRQALTREQALRSSFDQQRKETLTQNEAAINYRIIQQEIETNKGLLDSLLQRSKENDMVLAGTPNNVLVLDYAIVPNAPIGPKRLRTVALAFLLALTFAIGLALCLEYLNDTIRSTDDVEGLLHLPALSVIPSIPGITNRRLLRSSKSLRRLKRNSHPELLINSEGSSALAEAYRHLRTSILLSTGGRAPKTFLVSSSLPVEGKTTTAVNIAFSLAQTGAKVLLVDGDMRRPRIHSIFDVQNKNGLSAILSTNMSEADILRLVAQHKTSGLYLVTSGPVPANPAELIGSDQMRRFIQLMERVFDHIIFDSPPIASVTDSVLLSSMVDGVLLVVHGGKSSHKVVRRSQQIMQEAGARIFGVVLNNTTVDSDDYYFYTHHYNGYYKAESDADQVGASNQVIPL